MEAQTQLIDVIEECGQDPYEVIVEDIVDDGPPDLADQAYERWRDDQCPE